VGSERELNAVCLIRDTEWRGVLSLHVSVQEEFVCR